jgi:8-oxo-dGTP pyrophosphatase MutT (NUDIX family)
MEPDFRRKAIAYITRETDEGTELLLLYHPDHPEAGIQVPAGTLEPDEPVLDGARREAFEETGLDALDLVGVLGECEVDARAWGRNEIQHRWFVHFRCPQPTPMQWDHWEEDPSDAPGTRIRFTLKWTRLDRPLPEIVASFAAYFDELRDSLGIDIGS